MNNKESGFSLIELLIALGLSVFLLSSTYLLFFTQHRSYLGQQSLIQLQDNAHIAINMVRNDLQQAGGLGCTSWHSQLPVYNQARSLPEWIPTRSSEVIRFFYANLTGWNPPLPSYLHDRVKPETDVMLIHKAYEESADLLQTMISSDMPLLLPGELNIKIGDILMIADCEQADIFQISHLLKSNGQWWVSHQPPYNTSSALSKAYGKEAYISLLQSVAYYIGDTDRRYPNSQPIYALHQFIEQHNELIEGVSDLKIDSVESGKVTFTLETQAASLLEIWLEKWTVITTLRNHVGK